MLKKREWTPLERKILAIVQADLPDSLTPYADIAARTGSTEQEVLDLLQSLKQNGTIRRFGASLKHQQAGFSHNAMVAWKVRPENMDQAGAKAAEHPNISHCYYRPSPARDWPYELYTMIHGKEEKDCQRVIDELTVSVKVFEGYTILTSLEELKKGSMSYFQDAFPD